MSKDAVTAAVWEHITNAIKAFTKVEKANIASNLATVKSNV